MGRGKRAAAAVAAGVLYGLAQMSGQAHETEEKPLRAAIFYHEQTWLQDFNIVHEIAEAIEKNLDGHPEVAFSRYGMESVSVEHVVKLAIRMKTDVLLFLGTRSETSLEYYQALSDEGIRLILVDGDVEESGRYAYIGTDNYGVGEKAADFLAETLEPQAEVAVLAPVLQTGLRSVGARLDGFFAGAEENGVNIVDQMNTSYDSLTAISTVETLLDEHPALKALFCADAVSGQAAADVLEARGRSGDTVVITFDRNEKIENALRLGALDLTYTQDTETIGEACAQALVELAADRTQMGEDRLFPCIELTAQDLEGR